MDTAASAPEARERYLTRAVEASIRIALVAIFAVLCVQILSPFLIPLVWGGVLAVALLPACRWVERWTGGRRKLAATLLVVVGIGALLVPTLLLSGSLLEGARAVTAHRRGGGPPKPSRARQGRAVADRRADGLRDLESRLDEPRGAKLGPL